MNSLKNKIRFLEVGLRDGIQNEKKHFNLKDRFHIFKKLIASGIKDIEIGSFVSPRAIPQMRLTKSLIQKIYSECKLPKDVHLYVLVPNEYGFERALELGIKNVSIIASATESFSQRNTHCSIKENLKKIKNICGLARRHHITVRGYLSMAFGCPYEGDVPQKKVIQLSRQIMEQDLKELALSDTIGIASPLQVRSLVNNLNKHIPLSKISLHCHNTRGMALPNILEGLNIGIRSFDSSIGGLGGCPYAQGSSGNVATEDMIVLLEGMSFNTGVEINKLVRLSQWIQKTKKVKLSSHISKLSKDFQINRKQTRVGSIKF